MGKIIPIPVWGILLALCGFTATVLSYAYVGDNSTQDIDILENKNDITIIKKDLGIYATKSYVIEKVADHEKVQAAEMKDFANQLSNLEITVNTSNVTLTKYLDQRFDDMEKLINKSN